MSEFKVGDEVWNFSLLCLDTCCIDDIGLECDIIESEGEAYRYSDQSEYYYKSKREALEALSRRLKELLDDV